VRYKTAFQSIHSNLSNIFEKRSAARSRDPGYDFARETAELTRWLDYSQASNYGAKPKRTKRPQAANCL